MEVIIGMRWAMPTCGENIRVLEIKTGLVDRDIINGVPFVKRESKWHSVPIEVISDEEFVEKGYFE
jgi:hypothetical protein